jgi:hypothetical protein
MMITTTNTGATNVTAAELAQLGRDLPSVGEIDTELVRRLPTAAIDAALGRRGLVLMKMLMPQHGRRTGQVFACSERVAQGYDVFGSAVRVTS